MSSTPDMLGEDCLNLLLDELDVRAQKQHLGERSESYWVCQRRHPRHPFRVGCTIHFFPQGSSTLGNLIGRTRNLSRSGVAVLVRRVFRSGEPIEIEIVVPDRPRMYMAGLVTFCRYAGRGFHEVGVQLHTAGNNPVFCTNPAMALDRLEWLRVGQRTMMQLTR